MFIAIAITSSVTNTGLVAKCAVYALGSIANQVGHFFHRLGEVLHKTPLASRLMIKEDEQLVPSETQPGVPSSYELTSPAKTIFNRKMSIAIAITSSVNKSGLVAKCAVYALGSIANQVGHFFHRLGEVLHKTPLASRLMIKEDEQLVPSETQPGVPSSYELTSPAKTIFNRKMSIAIAITSSVNKSGLVAKCAVYALGSIANQVGHFFHRLGEVLHKTPLASRLMIKEDEQLVPSETQPGVPSSYELIQYTSPAIVETSRSKATSNLSNFFEGTQVVMFTSIMLICFMASADWYHERIVTIMLSAIHTFVIDTKRAVAMFLGLQSGTFQKKSITPLCFIQMHITERFVATIIVTVKNATRLHDICNLLWQPRYYLRQNSSSADASISITKYLAKLCGYVKEAPYLRMKKSRRCMRQLFRFCGFEVFVLLCLLVLCVVSGWNAPHAIRVDGNLEQAYWKTRLARVTMLEETILNLKVTPSNPIARPNKLMLPPLPELMSGSLFANTVRVREAIETSENSTDLDPGLFGDALHVTFWKDNDDKTTSISHSNFDLHHKTAADSLLVSSVDLPHWTQYMNNQSRAAFNSSLFTICELKLAHSEILFSYGFAWKKCIAVAVVKLLHGHSVSAMIFVKLGEGSLSANQHPLRRSFEESTDFRQQLKLLGHIHSTRNKSLNWSPCDMFITQLINCVVWLEFSPIAAGGISSALIDQSTIIDSFTVLQPTCYFNLGLRHLALMLLALVYANTNDLNPTSVSILSPPNFQGDAAFVDKMKQADETLLHMKNSTSLRRESKGLRSDLGRHWRAPPKRRRSIRKKR